jgi:hypothetical protein
MYKKRTKRYLRKRRTSKKRHGGNPNGTIKQNDIENQLNNISDVENNLEKDKKNIDINISGSVDNLEEYRKKHEELFQPSKDVIDIYHTWYKEPNPYERITQSKSDILKVPMDIETNIKSDENFNLGDDYGQYDTQFYGGIRRKTKTKRRKHYSKKRKHFKK